jgi:hypothetical protein
MAEVKKRWRDDEELINTVKVSQWLFPSPRETIRVSFTLAPDHGQRYGSPSPALTMMTKGS